MTALVPSEIACLASSPGRRSEQADETDLEDTVFFPLTLVRAVASFMTLSKVSCIKEFMIFIALLEIPTSG